MVVGLALFPALGLLLIEGASSVIVVVDDLGRDDRPRPLEMRHSQYDTLLGWANLRNVTIPDMYGPGVYLHLNGQGFRSNHDVAAEVGPGRLRVICSGDSFTLGYGVDDDHTWCEHLTAKNGRFETVNMGEAGYGIDQAYLWYKRDGVGLEHAVQVLAYIAQDFGRMQSAEFNGYPKPTLAIHNGLLVTEHEPVPRRPSSIPWVTRARRAFASLRLHQLVQRIRKAHSGDDSEARATAARL